MTQETSKLIDSSSDARDALVRLEAAVEQINEQYDVDVSGIMDAVLRTQDRVKDKYIDDVKQELQEA